jgi:hypothetical protein
MRDLDQQRIADIITKTDVDIAESSDIDLGEKRIFPFRLLVQLLQKIIEAIAVRNARQAIKVVRGCQS